jgi:hypothetical protein
MPKTVLVACMFASVFALATAQAAAQTIEITRAEVRNGLAVVQGKGAAASATVTWEGASVTTTNAGGVFRFLGVVPADCVGTLSDGSDIVEVAIAKCTPMDSRVLKTGQTTCYDLFAVVACAGTGQDGELQIGATRSYSVNGDGTITDNYTGLMWETLTNPGDGSIHDYLNFYDWPRAFQKIADLNASNFAGHSDWRLPNINELLTLVDYGRPQPEVSIDPVFNNGVDSFTNEADSYFSSTTRIAGFAPDTAWVVSFRDGGAHGEPKWRPYSFVRAVRGGER